MPTLETEHENPCKLKKTQIVSLEVGPWTEVLPMSSPRLDSRLDVRRNQVLNLVNVSFDEFIAIVFFSYQTGH